MRARDIMTTDVISVRPDTPIKELAQLMVERRISGLPVIADTGELVGIVTDGDMYRRGELATERPRDGWLNSLFDATDDVKDYVRSHGEMARDVMSREVLAVDPDASLQQVADLLETNHIRRVPVVKDSRVIGIISRANLVQALTALPDTLVVGRLGDSQVRDLALAEFARLPSGVGKNKNVIVEDGRLHVWGSVLSETEVMALRVAAEHIPGVTGFVDHLTRWTGIRATRAVDRPAISILMPIH
jgi:CBS domain-containing protein